MGPFNFYILFKVNPYSSYFEKNCILELRYWLREHLQVGFQLYIKYQVYSEEKHIIHTVRQSVYVTRKYLGMQNKNWIIYINFYVFHVKVMHATWIKV